MPSFAKWLVVIISGCLSAFVIILGFFTAKQTVEDQAGAFGVMVLLLVGLLCTNLFEVRREIKIISRWLISGVVFIPFVFIFSYFVGQAQSNWKASTEAAQTSSAGSDGSTGSLSSEDQKIFDEVMSRQAPAH